MGARDIEIWTLQVIDRLKQGQPIEDSRVELKSDWPESDRAARRIAAHANAARGEPILWIIGVDEAQGKVLGAQYMNLANWLPQVQSHFDELVPDLTDVAVSVDATTVVALGFATDRAPYIIKHSQGVVTREVPWREGTRTRSATRSEILLIFASVPQLPDFELLGAELEVFPNQPLIGHSGNIRLEVYIRPRTREQIVLPLYDTTLTYQLMEPTSGPLMCRILRFGTHHPYNHFPSEVGRATRLTASTIHVRERDVVVNGPGSLYITGEFDHVLFPDGYQNRSFRIQLTISHASFPRPIMVQADVVPGPFIPPGNIEATYWRLPHENRT